MKLKIFSSISLVFFLFNGSVSAQNQLYPENCCYHIWAAGCRLGWATSHMYYTQTRPYWKEGPDRRIYDNILRAGWHIENANRTCNPGATQAWPNWKLKKDRLERIATSFGNNPTPHNREQLAKELWSTQGFSTPLRVVATGTQVYNEATCSEKYFKMGWWIGYIQQTLQIANESLGYGNPRWRDQVQHAKNLMGNLLNVLYEYSNLTPITGNCASSGADLIRRVRDIQGKGISPSNLKYMMNGFNMIWEKGQTTISNGCNENIAPPNYPLTYGTSSVNHSGDTGHNVQCWRINQSISRPGRWKLSIQHAAAGVQGGFHIVAWSDTNGNGLPNHKIGQSKLMITDKAGKWSSWEFYANSHAVFVGNSWPQQNEIIYYQMGGVPSGYKGLGNINYYSRKFNEKPVSKASPRYTNIKLEYIGN